MYFSVRSGALLYLSTITKVTTANHLANFLLSLNRFACLQSTASNALADLLHLLFSRPVPVLAGSVPPPVPVRLACSTACTSECELEREGEKDVKMESRESRGRENGGFSSASQVCSSSARTKC